MPAKTARAAAERSVSVGGDVVGSVIITGDHNNLRLVLGEQHGALLEQLARAERPGRHRRPAPIRAVPPQLPNAVDRDREARLLLDAIASSTPANLIGPRGIGKTYAVLRALNAGDASDADAAVYLWAPGPLDDLLQQLFESFYECDPPYRPSTAQLRRDLADVEGVVVLDSVELERDAAQQLLLALPGCRVVISSRARVLWEGTTLTLEGLDTEHAVSILEQELGRRLREDEVQAGRQICALLEGHPLRIREAAAEVGMSGGSLQQLAEELDAATPQQELLERKLSAAGDGGRELLAALTLFDGATLGRDRLRAIVARPDFDALLMAALRRGDVRAHSPRYTVGVTIGGALATSDLSRIGDRALDHFRAWARANRDRPATLLTERAAILALLRWGRRSGRDAEVVELGRAVDHAFALERRFGSWHEALTLIHQAARASGDRGSEAWALHQLGTRAVCLGEVEAGTALLSEALELRRSLGDEPGQRYSSHNLSLASRPRWFTSWLVGHPLLVVIAIVLVAGAVVAAAALPHRSHAPAAPSASAHALGGHRPNRVHGRHHAAPTKPTAPSPAKPSAPSHQPGKPPSGAAQPPARLDALTVVAPPAWRVTDTAQKISCPGACTASFPAGTTVMLHSSERGYWENAPNCPAPPPAPSTSTGQPVPTTSQPVPTTTASSTTPTSVATTTSGGTSDNVAQPSSQSTQSPIKALSTTVAPTSADCEVVLDGPQRTVTVVSPAAQ